MSSIKYYNDKADTSIFKDREHLKVRIKEAKNGDSDAMNEVVNSFLRLVIKVSGKFIKSGISQDDLISEGTVGVIKAINGYDESHNVDFHAYVNRAIFNRMTDYTRRNQKVISMPKLAKGNYKEIYNSLNSGMSIEEMYDKHKNKRLVDFVAGSWVSMDDSGVDGEYNMHEVLPAPISFKDNDLREFFYQFTKDNLKDQEHFVLTKLYGLDGKEELTADDLAVMFSVSRQRIHQIKDKGFLKLRNLFDCYGGKREMRYKGASV